jgi:hypothetical protein
MGDKLPKHIESQLHRLIDQNLPVEQICSAIKQLNEQRVRQ